MQYKSRVCAKINVMQRLALIRLVENYACNNYLSSKLHSKKYIFCILDFDFLQNLSIRKLSDARTKEIIPKSYNLGFVIGTIIFDAIIFCSQYLVGNFLEESKISTLTFMQ